MNYKYKLYLKAILLLLSTILGTGLVVVSMNYGLTTLCLVSTVFMLASSLSFTNSVFNCVDKDIKL